MARQQRETAIGYISEDGPLVLAPQGTDRHVYAPADVLIIIGNRVSKPAKRFHTPLAATALRPEVS